MKCAGIFYWLVCFLFIVSSIGFRSFAQESVEEEAFENLSAANEENVDEADFPRLESLKDHPLNLNIVEFEQLQELPFLNAIQIKSLLNYRTLLGDLVSLYELQAVPGWDLPTIKQILPYVTVAPKIRLREELSNGFTSGVHTIVFRASRMFERSNGFKSNDNNEKKFVGSAFKTLLRHRYTNANLQYGFQIEKDPGENFFNGHFLPGDFFSFYICLSKIGIFNKLIVGDFVVNMGQGLILWQGPGFGKTSDALAIKKQAAILRPYQSGGEVNYLRGVGFQSTIGRATISAFVSNRKLDGNVEGDSLRSFVTTGLHRTKEEQDKKNSIGFVLAGASINLRTDVLNLSWNSLYEGFSAHLSKERQPYNLYSLNGKTFFYNSISYDLTYRNIHLFGELATVSLHSFSMVNGALMSAGRKVDLSVLMRLIQPSYHAWNNKVFGENSSSSNETGFYVGITLRPAAQWKIDAYVDIFSFPWLKFRLDAPSAGSENLLTIQFKPSKKVETTSRLRWERKQVSDLADNSRTNSLVDQDKFSMRYQVKLEVSRNLSVRKRLEFVCLNMDNKSETGFLCFADASFRMKALKMKTTARLQYFSASDYAVRVFAFENDVSPGISIPSFYNTGWRYYLLFNIKPLELFSRKLSKKINVELSMRWSQTLYSDELVFGSGVDEFRGNSKTEFHVQLRFLS